MATMRGLHDLYGNLRPNSWIADTSQRRGFTTDVLKPPQSYAGTVVAVNDEWTQYSTPVVSPPQQTEVRWGLIISDASGYWTDTVAATYGLTGDQAGLYQLAWRDYGTKGTGPFAKFFDGGGGITVPWNAVLACDYGSKPNETSVTLCYKGTFNQANFVSICRQAVARFAEPIRVVWEQESDRNGGPSVASWQAQVTQQWDTIQADPQLINNVQIWLSLTGYNQYEVPRAGKQMEDFFAGLPSRVKISGIQVDMYQMNGSYWTPTWSPVPELTNMSNRSTALGVPFYLGEWGTTPITVGGDSDALRATRTQAFIDFLNNHPYDAATGTGCLGGSYWENYAGDPSRGATTESDQGLLSKESTWPLTFATVKNALWTGP